MLANSELVIMLNQAATDREQLAELRGISDLQMGKIYYFEKITLNRRRGDSRFEKKYVIKVLVSYYRKH